MIGLSSQHTDLISTMKSWTSATDNSSEANTAADISSVLKDFISSGPLYFRAYLESDGSQACELEELKIN